MIVQFLTEVAVPVLSSPTLLLRIWLFTWVPWIMARHSRYTLSSERGEGCTEGRGSRGRWTQDRNGNGDIKHRNFTTPFGQQSAPLSSEISLYSSKARVPCGRLACVCVSGGGGLLL